MADTRPVPTDAEREEHVRHLAALDYACIFGACDHPACAWRYDEVYRVVHGHAPHTRNPLLPRDFTLPHVTDEDD